MKPSSNKKPFITAVVLAAGLSRRMYPQNKLLIPYKGKPVIHHTLSSVCLSQVDRVIVVTGHQSKQVEDTLKDFECSTVHNPDYEQGMASSLVCAIRACSDKSDAMLICLGDMPHISKQIINSILAAFDPEAGKEICVPVFSEKRGNPVLWSRRFFPYIAQLTGDTGARHLIEKYSDLVINAKMQSASVLEDIDSEDDYLHP